MAEGIGGKIKDFFGLSEADTYQDPYERDSFVEDRPSRRDDHDVAYRPHAREDDHLRGAHSERYSRPAGHRDYSSRPAVGSTVDPVDPVGERPYYEPSVPAAHTPQVLRFTLSSHRQAGELAEALKGGDVVVFSLDGMEKSEAARVLDFAAGLSAGAQATLKKLAGVRNYVLIPQGLTLEQSQLDQLAKDN